ncbi:hypothetical protein CQW23_18406 [Capsicum baccatum]|uniref:non-specific serine/threonine protein kinase n=1 Tax=Capsicum baccatum TaxID=33114 RepID=A0A2G2W2T8_CAPBA|nr:hypothetical protein CQW23_18406 [Capsicum baccatum]
MEIGKMTQLNVLDLSHNLLVGGIPPQLANLKVLVDLNLSHSGLSGNIPEEVEKLAYTMKVTQMCDVYSFGVLALEIIKGKHLGEYITVLANSSTMDHHVQLSDFLDERLPYPEDRVNELLVFIIKLASSCLVETPKSRPTMQFISHKLSSMDAYAHPLFL